MSQKKFVKPVLWLIISNLIIKLIWVFFIERNVQIAVGFENYGLYYSIFNFTLILTVINDPGLNNYLIRCLSKGEQNTRLLSSLLYTKIALSFIYLVITLITAYILNYSDYQLVTIVIIYQILYSFLMYLRGFLKGYQLFKADVIFSIADKFLLIIVFGGMFIFRQNFEWSVQFYITCQVIVLLFVLCFNIWFLQKKGFFITKSNSLKGQFNLSLLKNLAPFALFSVLVLAYNKVDAIMLMRLSPQGNLETGIYAAAYRFLDAATMLPILFASFLLPVLSKLSRFKQSLNLIIKDSLSFLIATSVIIAISCWVFKEDLMFVFYPHQVNNQLVLVFGAVMFCLPFVVLYYVYSTVLTATNKLFVLNLISAVGLVANVVSNFYLIPQFGALGAAVSSVISFASVGVLYLIYYHVYSKNKFYYALWIRLLCFILVLLLLGFLTSQTPLVWYIHFLLFTILAFLLGFLFKFFSFKFSKLY